MLVLLDFVHIVPDALPHLYVIVCVKLLDFRVTVKVCAAFNVPLLADRLDFLGIVASTTELDAATVPLLTPDV